MRTAILFLGYNRPAYFRRSFESLQENEEAHCHNVFVYLDGGPGSTQREIEKCVEESSFSNLELIKRDSNWGIGRNLIDARKQLFDVGGYDRIILFEDDMVLNSDYVKTVLELDDWARAYSDVGTVMAYNLNSSGIADQEACLDQVICTNRHFWGYCLSRHVWEDIKPLLFDYETRFLSGISYRSRPHKQIRQFIHRTMNFERSVPSSNRLIPDEILTPPFPRVPRFKQFVDGLRGFGPPTSQDAITALALWINGYGRLTTVVPRAKYIGEDGEHFNSFVFKKQGFDQQKVFDFSTAKCARSFKLLTDGDRCKPGYYE